MRAINKLAELFGTHNHCIQLWIDNLNITEDEIEFAIVNFTKAQRFKFITEYIRPSEYLLDHPELIDHVQRIGVDNIKSLPESVFLQHLEQLQNADRIGDLINKRSFPYNDYDAQVFLGLRHAENTSDIKFIKRMFGRSISHHTYPNARQKLNKMCQQLT